MGEYIKFQGEHIKLGTCEDLYYVTYDQLIDMVQNGAEQLPGNLPPGDYLGNGFRYRFPFPNDDGSDFDKGVIVTVPPELLPTSEHSTIWKPLAPKGVGYNINAQITCPQSPDADPKQYSQGPHTRILEIVQQKAVDGSLWTVVRCPYCRSRWRFCPEEAAKLTAHIRKAYTPERSNCSSAYFFTIADRIEAGYKD